MGNTSLSHLFETSLPTPPPLLEWYPLLWYGIHASPTQAQPDHPSQVRPASLIAAHDMT